MNFWVISLGVNTVRLDAAESPEAENSKTLGRQRLLPLRSSVHS